MSISDISEIPDVADIPGGPKDVKPVDLDTGPATSSGNERSDLPLYRTERIIASLTVAWVIILTTYSLFQNGELSYTSVYFLKIILSLSGAVMLATLPGFFDVSYSLSGFSVRAAGGAAAFVFIYTQSPNLPVIEKYEKSTSPSVEEQQPREKQKNEKISVLSDEYPVLFVLSVSPASFAPAFYQPQPASRSGGSNDWAFEEWQDEQHTTISASVIDGASGTIARLVEYLRAGFAYASTALDMAAGMVRSIVDRIIETAKSLLGLQSAIAPPALNLFTETEDVTGALLNQDSGLSGSLFSAVDLVNTLALGGLGETLETIIVLTDTTVDPVFHLVDTTTYELAGTVNGTTDQLLYTADRLLGVATGALDRLTGGLTQPAGTLAHETIGKVDKLTDAALPATADTVSKVLGSVNNGLDTITGKLNEISPKIISRLDPEFAVAAEKSGNGLSGGVAELPGNILAETPLLDLPETPGLLDEPLQKLTSATLLGDIPAGERSPIADGTTCIAGCDEGQRFDPSNDGLRRTLKGVTGMIAGGSNSEPVFGLRLGSGGGLSSGGSGGPGLVGGGFDNSGSDGGPGNSGPQGGLISSTVNATGSILGNTLGKLKK